MGITDSNGELIAEYSYDEWGKLLGITTAQEDNAEQLTVAEINPFRYRGYYYDNETGMYYLQSRYYDPDLCRFISADDFAYINTDTPMSVNAYVYCINNPLKYSDSTGHDVDFNFVFALLRKLFIIDFTFPEFRYIPKKTSTATKKISNWVSDAGEVIGVVITEIFTCLDLQEIAKILKIDFSFTDWTDYLQEKVDIYRKYFDSRIDTGTKDNIADKSGYVTTILGMIPNLPIEINSLLKILPYIFALNSDYSGRYISANGSFIMALYDIIMGGIIDVGGLILEKLGMAVTGILFTFSAEKIYNLDEIRKKAEFIAYNWYYLLFVDWSKI